MFIMSEELKLAMFGVLLEEEDGTGEVGLSILVSVELRLFSMFLTFWIIWFWIWAAGEANPGFWPLEVEVDGRFRDGGWL